MFWSVSSSSWLCCCKAARAATSQPHSADKGVRPRLGREAQPARSRKPLPGRPSHSWSPRLPWRCTRASEAALQRRFCRASSRSPSKRSPHLLSHPRNISNSLASTPRFVTAFPVIVFAGGRLYHFSVAFIEEVLCRIVTEIVSYGSWQDWD